MSRPKWMVENAIAALQDLVAVLETIATGHTLNPTRAAVVAVKVGATSVVGISAGLVALYNALPILVSRSTGIDPSIVPAFFALARGIGRAMVPEDAVAAFAYAVDALPDAVPALTASPNRIEDASNMQIIARVSRMVLLAPYAEGLVGVSFTSRPDGVTARADCVERFEREIEISTGRGGGDASVLLSAVRNRVVDYLSRVITSLADVVTVSSNRPMPSLWWAWRLYQDPLRATELVARNDVAHPSFMPLTFTALQAKT